jgi:hypothetical protein
MGFSSQSEFVLHFGIPHGEELQRIEVRWPSGRTQVLEGDEALRLLNRTTVIEEAVEGGEDVVRTP